VARDKTDSSAPTVSQATRDTRVSADRLSISSSIASKVDPWRLTCAVRMAARAAKGRPAATEASGVPVLGASLYCRCVGDRRRTVAMAVLEEAAAAAAKGAAAATAATSFC